MEDEIENMKSKIDAIYNRLFPEDRSSTDAVVSIYMRKAELEDTIRTEVRDGNG